MSRLTTIALRVLQGLLAAGNLGLSAYVVDWYRVKTPQPPPSSADFFLFASIMSVLSILYLELSPRFLHRLARPYLFITVEGLNSVLYFAGFIAFAIFGRSLTFCKGVVCSATRGDCVLAAGAFCAWIASTILAAKKIIIGEAEMRKKPTQAATQMRDV